MDFDLSDDQRVIADLAAKLFDELATVERVRNVERSDRSPGYDRDLWAALHAANLLGLCLPQDCGGSGYGAVELALLAEAQGRCVAPVPLVPTIATAMTVGAHAGPAVRKRVLQHVIDDGAMLTSALATPGVNDGSSSTVTMSTIGDPDGHRRLQGAAIAVPYAQQARWLLVPAHRDDGTDVVAIVPRQADGVTCASVTTTDRRPHADVELDVDVEPAWVMPGVAALELRRLTLAANAALLTGVADGALAMAARHVSERQQFGRPLAAFQAVRQRAADAYITVSAMRETALSAAWHLSAGYDAERETQVAAFWAAEGGQQVTQACQHLHGGIGADIDYPAHRYFLWAMQIGNELGSATAHLSRLGAQLAGPPKGDA